MQRATAALLSLALGCALAAWLFYLWWGRLMAKDFAACLASVAPEGVDCGHLPQFYAILAFATASLALLVATSVRGILARQKQRFSR